MNGHHITFVSHTLSYECLTPWQVSYHSSTLAAAKACGEHDDVAVARERLLHHLGKIARLCPYLIDRYA